MASAVTIQQHQRAYALGAAVRASTELNTDSEDVELDVMRLALFVLEGTIISHAALVDGEVA